MHDTPSPAARTTTPAPAPQLRIDRITPRTLPPALDFIAASRRILFPSLGPDALFAKPGVLDEGCVMVMRDVAGSGDEDVDGSDIVAAIAYVPFDYRFGQLPWPLGDSTSTSSSSSSTSTSTSARSSNSSLHTPSSHHPVKVVEVLRLFVHPAYRRNGLAASLFAALRQEALEKGVQCMYLHTHPFLPGAIGFWEKQGFEIVCVDEDDEVWRTHHMCMMLGGS